MGWEKLDDFVSSRAVQIALSISDIINNSLAISPRAACKLAVHSFLSIEITNTQRSWKRALNEDANANNGPHGGDNGGGE